MKRPGVMIRDVLKRLSTKPVTHPFPAEPSPAEPGYRGMIEFDLNTCIRCGMCARDCPSFACVMEPAEDGGKPRPVFYMDRCMFCAQCEESCPKDCITLTQKYDLAHLAGTKIVVK